MPFNPRLDPTNGARERLGLGRKARVVTPSDTDDLEPYARAIEVVTAGNLVFLPMENDDADTITVTAAPVGYRTSVAVRRVLATGTTAAVVTVDD